MKTLEEMIALVPDYIDVAAVHGDYKWMARDADGTVWLYNSKPSFNVGSHWWSDDGSEENAEVFASFRRGTVAPEDSLLDLDAMRKERGLL